MYRYRMPWKQEMSILSISLITFSMFLSTKNDLLISVANLASFEWPTNVFWGVHRNLQSMCKPRYRLICTDCNSNTCRTNWKIFLLCKHIVNKHCRHTQAMASLEISEWSVTSLRNELNYLCQKEDRKKSHTQVSIPHMPYRSESGMIYSSC
jgi:hypothetical protein